MAVRILAVALGQLAFRGWAGLRYILAGLLLGGLVGAHTARAQAPAWSDATIGSMTQASGMSYMGAVATDASGNVFVTGYFTGQVYFGSTLLSSTGQEDLFVAKYVPGTRTWAWAQSGGGTARDFGYGIAVSGNHIYLTGTIGNDTRNSQDVHFGGTGTSPGTVVQYGATSAYSADILVAKYTDGGTSVTLDWTQIGGGGGDDAARGVAVSGTSVYVTGTLYNDANNTLQAVFGGSGTTPGTAQVKGACTLGVTSDLIVAKFTDNGASATLGWTQVGGGVGTDSGYGVTASGNSVYVTGALTNDVYNDYSVWFGGGGTTVGTVPVLGASSVPSLDLLVVKYTDNGASATLGWTQVGGGTGVDIGRGIAASGNAVYVTGNINNSLNDSNQVRFGGSGTTPGAAVQVGASNTASPDLVVAKYTDNGVSATLGWTQVGGGTGGDYGYGIAASGNAVYVTGNFTNTAANTYHVAFGGTGITTGTVQVNGGSNSYNFNIVTAKYTDLGTSGSLSWTQVAGGSTDSYGIAVGSSGVFVVATVFDSPALSSFGTASGSPVLGTRGNRAIVAQLAPGTGDWQVVTPVFNGGASYSRAVATDASGNVFVTGYFTGQVYFGSTLLSSTGQEDLFVAKYVPGTRTWAWAQSGGGASRDYAQAIAVSGNRIYLTGSVYNDTRDSYHVLFGGTGTTLGTASQYGASSQSGDDIVVAKFTDMGTSATFNWSQVGGGTQGEGGNGIAVSGANVYVTGNLYNNIANRFGVVFGGSGTTPGTVVQSGATGQVNGSLDLVVAKYTDNGASATLGWTQVGGGTIDDFGQGVAVNGTNVYVTGTIFNTRTNGFGVVFGGSGTTPGTVQQYGPAGSGQGIHDIVVAKYTDNGTSATLGWTQVGGGTGNDEGYAIAASGTSVYITGTIQNNTANVDGVVFGGTGATAGTSQVNGATGTLSSDLLLAKYTDNGPSATFNWGQVGGGTLDDHAYGLAVSGSALYVTGTIQNNTANASGVVFGGSGTSPGAVAQPGASGTLSADMVVAKYTDTGTSATFNWSQAGGGTQGDYAYGIGVSGQNVLAVGTIIPTAIFGTTTVTTLVAVPASILARLVDTNLPPLGVSPVALAQAGSLMLYPNPSRGAVTLIGAAPGTAIQVLDALGQPVATVKADASGTSQLTAKLQPGLYVVRNGTSAARLAVE